VSASSHPGLAFAKGTPRIVETKAKRRSAARMDKVEKERVRVRDRESCRVCGRKTRHVHERLFKSRGGVASLDNSMCACPVCHPYLQHHGISVFGASCNGRLTFEMGPQVAKFCFLGRSTPSHVTVTI
jgi:hypothetical protein